MFRITIRDLLWLMALVAVLTTLAMQGRRARQREFERMTCGPNTLKPSDVWPNEQPLSN
jgi:hypothetical protein